VHLVLLKGKGTPECEALAEELYANLQKEGLDVLFDDRAESPGVKFNDADLIGIPVRLTVSERALKAGGVEFKRRDLTQKEVLPLDGLIGRVKSELDQFQAIFEQQATCTINDDF
jgi:prolyl-tRNA synthetase